MTKDVEHASGEFGSTLSFFWQWGLRGSLLCFIAAFLFVPVPTGMAQDEPRSALLVVQEGNRLRFVETQNYQVFREMVFFQEAGGGRTGVQPSDVLEVVLLPNGEIREWSEGERDAVAQKLIGLEKSFPSLKSQSGRILDAINSVKSELAKKAALEVELQSLLETKFSDYSEKEKDLFARAEQLVVYFPQSRSKIAAWKSAWEKDRAEALAAAVPETLPEEEPEDQVLTVEVSEMVLRLPGTVVPGATMLAVLGGLATAGLLVVIGSLSFLWKLYFSKSVVLDAKEARIHSSQRRGFSSIFSLLIGISYVVLLGAGIYFGWRLLGDPGSLVGFREQFSQGTVSGEGKVTQVLQDAVLEPVGSTLLVPAEEVDAFLAERIEFVPGVPSQLSALAMTRQGLACGQDEQAFYVAEELSLLGRPILIQYRLPFASDPDIPVQVGITANGLHVPGRIAAHLWASLGSQMAAAYKKSPIGGRLALLSPQPGGIALKVVAEKNSEEEED